MEIICFSHLRWDFVFQRPQHLLSRLAAFFRVLYIEEPVYRASHDHYTEVLHGNVHVVRLYVHAEPEDATVTSRCQGLVTKVLRAHHFTNYMLWYYTPMALPMSGHLDPVLTIYDCMDELSAFRFAPPSLSRLEKELLKKADVVFTGGHSLYEFKKHQHHNIHSFPSSIDKKHFGAARHIQDEPSDQQPIPFPRFGFYGVLDERFDIELIREVAEKKPEWNFILVGPIVKIDPASLPANKNIFYLGSKGYADLPAYLSGWNVALVSFALNESTRYISPTKTPEYLAGGKPVISTPIRDVVDSYGRARLVHIVKNADEFIAAGTSELSSADKSGWLQRVDKFLAGQSWDMTVKDMRVLIDHALLQQQIHAQKKPREGFTAHYIRSKPALPAAS